VVDVVDDNDALPQTVPDIAVEGDVLPELDAARVTLSQTLGELVMLHETPPEVVPPEVVPPGVTVVVNDTVPLLETTLGLTAVDPVPVAPIEPLQRQTYFL